MAAAVRSCGLWCTTASARAIVRDLKPPRHQGGRHLVAAAASNGNGVPQPVLDAMADVQGPRNVLGGPLQCCCTSPVTGYFRDGFCRTDASDHGRHVVCARVTTRFLEFSRSRGNDLMTPAPWYNFPGLKDGDRWCLCAVRWREALEAGCAPPIYIQATHTKALEYVTLEQLRAHAVDLTEGPA